MLYWHCQNVEEIKDNFQSVGGSFQSQGFFLMHHIFHGKLGYCVLLSFLQIGELVTSSPICACHT